MRSSLDDDDDEDVILADFPQGSERICNEAPREAASPINPSVL